MPLKPKGLSRREMLGVTIGLGVVASSSGLILADKKTEVPKRTATIDAKPGPITIDSAETAVIVVDMQNDFGSEGGMFHRAGIDISMIQSAVAPTAGVLAAARKESIKVIYLKMAFKADLSDAGPPDSVNFVRHRNFMKVGTKVKSPTGADSQILVRDTWNSDILSQLTPHPNDTVLYKTRFSGFYQTELDSILKQSGIKYLIFTGCTTSICVESTIRDAMFRDYLPVLLADCTGEPIGYGFPRSNHDASLLNIQTLFGWVSTSTDFMNALDVKGGAITK